VVENFISTPSGRVLTWHWYRLNDRELARDAEVKLRLAIDRLTGRADESAVVVLSTPVAEAGAERARAHLEAFLAAHAGAIRATLEAPAASIPR
jgi:EpsI family protein